MNYYLLSNKIHYIIYIVIIVQVSDGYLNLYLNSNEVQRLLGLDAELYYMRNGKINDYALNFTISVPPSISSLHFTWEALTPQTVTYTIDVQTNLSDFPTPELNITKTGTVSNSLEVFSISLHCPLTVSQEVDIAVILNISHAKTTTILTIKRKKICLRSDKSEIAQPDSYYPDSTNVFYIAMSSGLVLIFIITTVITTNCVRNKKRKRTSDNRRPSSFLTSVPRNGITTSYGSFRRMPSYSLLNERSKDLQERIAELTIQRCRVRLKNVILEGTFGRIYKGTYATGDSEETVIIKTVTDHASQVQISLLLQEGMSMYSLNHKNILSILRVSIEDKTAPFLLYPYNNTTNLKIFLQRCKLSSEGISHTLTTQEVVDMALQIIESLQYLHKKRLLHKDLAARNCVVDDKLKVKVADNALSRDLFPSDYHCLGDNENRPVKWLAIESLVQKTFSASSDVWSFGVLLWELTTLAQQPYVEIDPFEMAAYLKDGYRLAQPINCPDELFAVMAYCWAMSMEERPTVTQLQVCLQDFYAQLIRYV